MPTENLFASICAEVINSNVAERYLLVNSTLEMPGASASLKEALQDALQASGNNSVHAMDIALQYVPRVSGPRFLHDVSGVVETDEGSVKFHVREVCANPVAYDVLFQRVVERNSESDSTVFENQVPR